jgi:ABC-type molybdate transport system substrate-binding protein
VFFTAIVTVGVVVFGVRVFVRQDDPDQAGDECSAAQAVNIVADPSIAETIVEAADEYFVPETCADVTVTAEESSQTAGSIDGASVDLWIPDSTLWRGRLDNPDMVNSVGSIASSPLVVVMPRVLAEAELDWPDAKFAWADALNSDLGAAISNPETSTEGVITLLALRSALGDEADPTVLVGAMAAASRNVVPTVADAFAVVGAADGPMAFTATEQAVVAHNQSGPDVPVVAVYPTDGTLALDYPALVAAESPGRELASDFAEYLTQTQDAILSAGFRDRNDELAVGRDLGVLLRGATLQARPGDAEVQGLIQQWSALSRPMRMVAVIDVSGSMNAENSDGVTRIEQTRDAAQNALAMLREESSVGLWAFSTPEDQESGDPYTKLVELGPLTENVGDNTRLEALHGASESLPGLVDAGGTALYDTALAAFNEVFAGYEGDMENSVVLMTDGVNEDYSESIDLESLINSLESKFDPAKPVALITIGIGDGVDMEVLEQISRTTGASSYHAEDASEIERVFLQAMIERQCRPNC